MATKIRLQRYGRKNSAYFHLVIADSHSPRDGKFIEKIGRYNPNTNPAVIDLDFDRALYWLGTGAVPSETARAILSYKGVVYKNHLMNGVKKGAHTEAQVEEKFQAWNDAKAAKINAKKENIEEGRTASRKSAMEAETRINQARSEKLEARRKAALDALNPPAPQTEESSEAANAEETPAAE
jgi:small subunit ribosomal protein S16